LRFLHVSTVFSRFELAGIGRVEPCQVETRAAARPEVIGLHPLASTCIDARGWDWYLGVVDIEASARKHDVPDEDMLHAIQHHWRAFETDDPSVTMFIGPSRTAEPLEVGLLIDDEGAAIVHAMRARTKFLKGWWTT
jgi:hypothetical protein